MAGPYFKAKPLIEKYDVAVFSSNYNLYGDLSWRVMETLRMILGRNNVEVYSVDEAFLDLSIFPPNELPVIAEKIKKTVETWTGIKVSVGVAPTKVLAKVANRLSKKYVQQYKGVMVLNSKEKIIAALKQTEVGDIWGVGYQYAQKLKEQWSIYDAYQLSRMSEDFGKVYLGGVVGSRLLRELKGIPSKDMEEELVTKRMIDIYGYVGNRYCNFEESDLDSQE